MYDTCKYVCTWVITQAYICWGQRRMSVSSSIILCLIYSLETGWLTEPINNIMSKILNVIKICLIQPMSSYLTGKSLKNQSRKSSSQARQCLFVLPQETSCLIYRFPILTGPPALESLFLSIQGYSDGFPNSYRAFCLMWVYLCAGTSRGLFL